MLNKSELTIAALMAFMLIGCTPKTIEETSGNITAVSEVVNGSTKTLKIEMTPDSTGYDDSSFFFMAAQEVKEILAKITKHFPNQSQEQVEFVFSTKLVDRYGNGSDQPIIKLTFDMADIKKINFDSVNFTNLDLLGFVKIAKFPHPAGRKIVDTYCHDESNYKHSTVFCTVISLS